jgi:thymidylate kinase
VSPTGLWVAFLGPDGSGKSSVIDAVSVQMAPAFRRVSRFHFRPRLIAGNRGQSSAVTDPHGQAPRSGIVSIIKMKMLWADYVLGYLLRVRPALVRSTFVIFDRYFSDVLVDPKRVRYGGPGWLPGLVNAIIPQPDLLIILDAPVDVLYARKQEVALDQLEHLREGYLRIAASSPNAAIIDASQPLSKVIADTEARILLELERRTRLRLGLESAR